MAYLDTVKPGALRTWNTHNVLPSVVGAQAALESGWGTSRLAKPPYNNQFGIKVSDDWTGRSIVMSTREYINGTWITVNATFRAYDDPGDSVRDHGAFFTSTPWRENNYKAVVGEVDYKKACWALQNAPAPYATDNGYAQKLINLIESYNLQSWDREAMAESANVISTPSQQAIVSKMVGSDLTDAGKSHVKSLPVTVIGDSLGVGTKPFLEALLSNANYDVLGSRQITHATNSLNGTYILQQMKNAGTLKEYVVVILGTNRGVTEKEVDNFAAIAGAERKVIFVDTASEVAHNNTMSVYYQDAAKRLDNVYFANWRLKSTPLKPEYYSRDGANNSYLHMTQLGYQKHAEFIAQSLYEVSTGSFNERSASTPKAERYDIKTLELNQDGLITYDAWKVNTDKTSTKYKATKQTDIKGLYSPYGDTAIYNPAANEIWGTGNQVNQSDWIETIYQDDEETDMLELVQQAGRTLLDRSEPSRVYTISLLDIPVALTIGDTGIFIDHEYNPPLYIEARVLELTTSRTNPNLSKVTVGNVKELKVQDKSGIYALMAQLGEVRRDLVEERIQAEPIVMAVTTTNGFVLGDRVGETNLVARVMKGTLDVTEDYDNFKWERVSDNATSDTTYNQTLATSDQSSVLSVMAKDVIGNQSKFVARAYNATGELISHQEIVIKRVETALWVDTDGAPQNAQDGATWTDANGKQWVKVDGVWEERVDQAVIFTVQGDIDTAKGIANDAKAEADDARQRAEDALTEAGISTDLAQTAKDLADTANINAQAAISDASQAIGDFTVFKNNYDNTVDGITSELSKTAKITDLNGMVTESYLATNQYTTQGQINTQLINYLKTTDLNSKVKETVAYQDIKETTDRYTRVIGSTDAESRTKIAQIAMTDSVFKTTVLDKMEFDTSNTFSTKTAFDSLSNMLQLYRDESQAPNGIRFAGGAGGNGSFRLWNVITRNGWWTVSGWVRGSQNANGSFRLDIADSPYSHYISMGTDNDWKYFEFSHEVKNHSSTYNFVDFNNIANLYYYIKDLKIEQNHKATPYSFSAVDVATQSQVTQLANNWAVRMLNSKNDIVSQINLSDSTFLIEAKNIVGLGDAVINGKLTVTGDMIAGTISADKISGGTLTGTTFITTESAKGFSTHIYNGAIEFKHQIFTLGHIHATVSSTTGAINGFAVVQRPGYIFSINSRSNLPNNGTSTAVLQVPSDSTSESRKLNIFAQGGFRIRSDTLDIYDDSVVAKKPLRALDGFMASHEQSNEGAKIADAGNLIYSVDKAGSVMIHRFMCRRKDGTWPNNGLAIYEDGRVAVVVNGVWKQL